MQILSPKPLNIKRLYLLKSVYKIKFPGSFIKQRKLQPTNSNCKQCCVYFISRNWRGTTTEIRSLRTRLSSQSSHGFYEFIPWPITEKSAWGWSCTDVLQVSRLCSHFVYIQHSWVSYVLQMSCRSLDFVFIFSISSTFAFSLSWIVRLPAGQRTLFSFKTRLSDESFKPQRRDRNGWWSARTTRNKESNQRRTSARALKYTPDISVVLAKFSYYLKNLVTQYKNKYRVSSSGRRWQLIFTECTTEVLYTNRLTEISGLWRTLHCLSHPRRHLFLFSNITHKYFRSWFCFRCFLH